MITSWMLLAFGGVCLLGTLNALWPPKRIWFLVVGVFFWGWLTTELALHAILAQSIIGGLLISRGALQDWTGQAGLALLLLSLLGLVKTLQQSRGAEKTFEFALQNGLGAAYQPEKLPSPVPVSTKRLLFPFWTLPKVTRHRDIVFHEVDGIRLKLDIYRTTDERTKKPVLVQVHGGAWILGSKNEQGLPLMTQLASRGWICVAISYRLSPRAAFPDHVIDVKRALAWVKEHIAAYGGDPEFVVLTGGSAGGHLCSLAALTANQPQYQPGFESVDTSVKACVPCYGVFDFTERIKNPSFRLLLELVVFKASYKKNPEIFQEASPIRHIDAHTPPMFVIHGDNDTMVSVDIARDFVAELKQRSPSPVVYAELAGAQHAFEVFYSIRTAATINAIEKFVETIRRGTQA